MTATKKEIPPAKPKFTYVLELNQREMEILRMFVGKVSPSDYLTYNERAVHPVKDLQFGEASRFIQSTYNTLDNALEAQKEA